MFPVSLTWPLKTHLPGGEKPSSSWAAGKLNDLRTGEDSADHVSEPPTSDLTEDDYETLCHTYSSLLPSNKTLIVQNLQRLPETNELFYTDVSTDGGEVLRALVDSGSMACTLSETADSKLSQSIPNIEKRSAEDFVIVGCGGHPVTPSSIYDLTICLWL